MKFSESIRNLFFPEGIACIACKNEMAIPSEYGLCRECSIHTNTHFCIICGRGIVGEGDYCDDCKYDKRYFDAARASAIYENVSRTLVHKLKIGNEKYIAKYLARFMYDTYSETNWNADFMTFVPINKTNLRIRGFNQSEALAKELSKLNGLKVKDTLKRNEGKDLAKMGRKERAEILRNSFEAVEKFHGEKILLIDDIMTTGYTAEECAKMLKRAGASKVFVLTFATSVCKPMTY